MRNAAMALLGLVGSHAAWADTAVESAIMADTHWTTAGSPYLVATDIAVSNGAVLTIEAGVLIYMGAGSSLTVQQGGIQARGSAQNPIRVLSDRTRQGMAAPGDFGPWAFHAGTINTRLEHLILEHGSGIVVEGSAPVLNYVSLRNNRGAAITIDLAASPSGVGNEAIGNSLNGIAVPPGDIADSVKWMLRGIPYVVQTGTVSVGASPRVTQVAPAVIERGQTLTINVDGSRLDGLASASLDRTGVAITPFSGGTSSRLSFQVQAATDAELGVASLRLQVDAGEILVPNALTVSQPIPAITSIAPTSVFAGSGVNEIVVTGRNFNAEAEVLVNSAAVPTRFVSGTELRASLPNQTSAATLPVHVRVPDTATPSQYITSITSASLSVLTPVPPTVAFEPTPIAMPPDNMPHEIVIRLSKADYREHTLSLLLSDASKASISPAAITFAPGETTARVAITPLAQGSVTLTAQSATLGEIRVPLFITNDYQGVNTTYARAVGIVIEGDQSGTPTNLTVVQQGSVGVSVGSMLTGVSPRGWHRDSTQTLVVRGVGIPAGAQLSLSPSDDLTIGASQVSADGTTLTASVTAAASAAVGARRVVVRDANGTLLVFADAATGVVIVTHGQPRIDSVTPIRAARGSQYTLEIRGENLQGGSIDVLPSDGLEVDAMPQIGADGTLVTAHVYVSPDATLGNKVIRVTTPSGATGDAAVPSNTIQVVEQLGPTYSTVARIVGVMVGNGMPPATEISVPVLTTQLGLVVGASVTEVLPRAGVIGTTHTVKIRGQGLRDVTGIAFTPSGGLTVGVPTINVDGTELTFSLEVAVDAPLGLRRLALNSAAGPLAFANVADGSFLISAPLAEIDSVTPQVVKLGVSGERVRLLGRNLTNASDIRFVPATGITVVRPFTISADGTTLDFAINVDSAAATGTRTIVVTTPAGESSSDALATNSLKLASEIGPAYDAIVAHLVGISVDADPVSESGDGTWVAPLVGVVVAEPVLPVTEPRYAITDKVGILVGAAADGVAPRGWLQGASGNIRISGAGLEQVTAVSAMSAEGLLFGQPTANAEGTELSVPISVTDTAPLTLRRLKLATADGEVIWTDGAYAAFGIGRIPTMNSVSPIVLEAGKEYRLQIRGHDMQSVNGAAVLPVVSGVAVTSTPMWSQDALGELLEVSVRLDVDAPPGDRVLQLLVPGGATSAEGSVVNSFKVVRP